MTAAYRLKGLGWMSACAVVALGFYLVSIQVAAERKHLDRVNAQIDSAERDIRALETEFDVRSNLAQLERWNGETLSLVAPTAGQFMRDEAQLASLDLHGAQPLGDGIRTAALLVPAFHAPVIAETLPAAAAPAVAGAVATAATVQSKTAPVATVKVAAIRTAAVQTVARIVAPAPVTTAAPATRRVEAVVAKVSAPVRKAQAVAMLDETLLSDNTLGDILKGARAEAGRVR